MREWTSRSEGNACRRVQGHPLVRGITKCGNVALRERAGVPGCGQLVLRDISLGGPARYRVQPSPRVLSADIQESQETARHDDTNRREIPDAPAGPQSSSLSTLVFFAERRRSLPYSVFSVLLVYTMKGAIGYRRNPGENRVGAGVMHGRAGPSS